MRFRAKLRRMIPTPHEIFRRFERGEIDRDEMQALMAMNARELISEMEEDRQNPAAALLELLLSRRAAAKWVRLLGGRLVREILQALADAEDFPPSRLLWNASHPDVPLHCFFRIRREPVFFLIAVERRGERIFVETRHGLAGKGKGEARRFTLQRGPDWKLRIAE
jgi:hypothetical protein